MNNPKPVFMASDLQHLLHLLQDAIRAIHDVKKRDRSCVSIRLTSFPGTSKAIKGLLAWDHDYEYPDEIAPVLKRRLLKIRHRLNGMGHGTGLVDRMGPEYPEMERLDEEIGRWMKRLAAYPSYTKLG